MSPSSGITYKFKLIGGLVSVTHAGDNKQAETVKDKKVLNAVLMFMLIHVLLILGLNLQSNMKHVLKHMSRSMKCSITGSALTSSDAGMWLTLKNPF